MDLAPTAARTHTIDLPARSVSFDTTGWKSKLALIREYLDGMGVTYRVSIDEAERKSNLHTIIDPPGIASPGTELALSGHVDSVPVDGQAWTADPFSLRLRDRKLFARGSGEMKGFFAACLSAIPDFKARQLSRPLHLCISVNAVRAAGEAIRWVPGEALRLAAKGRFEAGFDPCYTSIHVGMVEGGTILNIIPGGVGFTMEWRFIPSNSPHQHLKHMQKRVSETVEPKMKMMHRPYGFTYKITLEMPGMALIDDDTLTAAVKQVLVPTIVEKPHLAPRADFLKLPAFQRSFVSQVILPKHIRRTIGSPNPSWKTATSSFGVLPTGCCSDPGQASVR